MSVETPYKEVMKNQYLQENTVHIFLFLIWRLVLYLIAQNFHPHYMWSKMLLQNTAIWLIMWQFKITHETENDGS